MSGFMSREDIYKLLNNKCHCYDDCIQCPLFSRAFSCVELMRAMSDFLQETLYDE